MKLKKRQPKATVRKRSAKGLLHELVETIANVKDAKKRNYSSKVNKLKAELGGGEGQSPDFMIMNLLGEER